MNYQKFAKFGKALIIGGAAIALAACSGGGSEEETANPEEIAAEEAAEAAEAASLQQAAGGEGTWGDIVYGDPNAPVEIIEYASLTCSHCANFATQIFPKIKEKYIDTGKVKFIYRNYVMNRYDMAASVVARCKGPDVAKRLQGVFFARQSDWLRAEDQVGALAGLARRAGGMSRTEFDRCMANKEMQEHLVKMGQNGAVRYKVNATPTIIVNGDKVDDYFWDNLQAVIDGEL